MLKRVVSLLGVSLQAAFANQGLWRRRHGGNPCWTRRCSGLDCRQQPLAGIKHLAQPAAERAEKCDRLSCALASADHHSLGDHPRPGWCCCSVARSGSGVSSTWPRCAGRCRALTVEALALQVAAISGSVDGRSGQRFPWAGASLVSASVLFGPGNDHEAHPSGRPQRSNQLLGIGLALLAVACGVGGRPFRSMPLSTTIPHCKALP